MKELRVKQSKWDQPPKERRMASKVLHLPELLEMILLNLEIKELFKLQMVNSTFRDVIAGSTPLQRKMFLLPDHSYKIQVNPHDALNPLIRVLPLLKDMDFELQMVGNKTYRPLEMVVCANSKATIEAKAKWLANSSPDAFQHGSWRKTLLFAVPRVLDLNPLVILSTTRFSSMYLSLDLKAEAKLGDLVDDIVKDIMERDRFCKK